MPKILKDLFVYLKEEPSPSLMKTFGIFGLVNFPLLYLLGSSLLNEHPIAIYLRLIGFIVCLPLALIEYWPLSINRYKSIYWFITITYTLPFFGAYMMILNEASLPWQVKITIGTFWLVLITNWVQFLVILVVGILLAILTFTFISGFPHFHLPNILGDFLNCAWAVVIASIFARRKELTQHARQQSLKMQAAAIAHEMRTPLSSIEVMSGTLQETVPILIESQKIVQESEGSTKKINPITLNEVLETPDHLKYTTRKALHIIDVLLLNLQNDIDPKLTTLSISKCVQLALQEYPLPEEDRNLLTINITDDFKFRGDETLIKHVLFNLMKNAIYSIKAAGKGSIRIWTGHGILYFEDTGLGIHKKHIKHIFDQFFTRTAFGSGVGLAFCKMVMTKLGGNIFCDSVKGEFTRFTLTFPVSENLQKK